MPIIRNDRRAVSDTQQLVKVITNVQEAVTHVQPAVRAITSNGVTAVSIPTGEVLTVIDSMTLSSPVAAPGPTLTIPATGTAALLERANIFTETQTMSLLHVTGSIATAYVAKTAAYTLTASDSIVSADATGGAFTLTLPTAVGITGREYVVKRINAGANNVTIDGAGSELIDGAATLVLTAQWQAARVVSNGAGWLVV